MKDRFPPAKEVVAEAWGHDAPDWITALAEARDTQSLSKVATTIGFSASSISNVLSNSYGASTANIESAVRGTIMNAPVICPELGPIKRARCARFAANSGISARASKLAANMARICPTCPLKPKKGTQQ